MVATQQAAGLALRLLRQVKQKGPECFEQFSHFSLNSVAQSQAGAIGSTCVWAHAYRTVYTRASSATPKLGHAALRSVRWSPGAISRGFAEISSRKQVATSVQSWLGSRLTSAISLQARGLWQKYRHGAYVLVGALAVYLIWRTTFRIASTFINVTESMAEWGFMGFAFTVVVLTALYLRSYFTIDPNRVYRLAMYRLNTSPAVLEVMGAPLLGSELRASVLTGGGFRIKNFKLKRRSPRLQMIFPLTGSDRKGLVSLEAKKKQGKYQFKLLAVDVRADGGNLLPTTTTTAAAITPTNANALASEAAASINAGGPAPRVYVEGDLQAYNKGGVLTELRDPFLRAVSLQPVYDVEDEVEEEMERIRAPKSKEVQEVVAQEAPSKAAGTEGAKKGSPAKADPTAAPAAAAGAPAGGQAAAGNAGEGLKNGSKGTAAGSAEKKRTWASFWRGSK